MNFSQFMQLLENDFDWNHGNEDDFINHHKTGDIPMGAYKRYESDGGLAWVGNKAKYPQLITTKSYGPYTVEFRQSGNKLQYVDSDEQGRIIRGEDGLSKDMSDERIKQLGLPVFDQTIIAFVDDKPVGMASNEWGSIGVWVEKAYQKLGIGSDLLVMFMKNDSNFLSGKGQIGQMTWAGEQMSRSAFRKLKGGTK